MEIKYNEATLNRPEGDRIIDAPFVFIDLKKYGSQLLQEEAWIKNDRNGITVYKTDGYTMVLSCLKEGALLEDNIVDGLITMQVMQGAIDFTIETGTVSVKKQQMITVHGGIMHTIKAVEDTMLLITSKVER